MKRRHLLAAGFGALAAPAIVRADAKFPDRTIRLVVPFPAAIPTPDTTPQRTAQFIKDELAKWAPVIRTADVKIT